MTTTTWSEMYKAALASIEDAEQKLKAVKEELATNEDVKSALLEVGEADVSDEEDDDNDDTKTAIENLSNAFDEAQGRFKQIAESLTRAASDLCAVL